MAYATLFSPGPRAGEDTFRYAEPEYSYLDRSPRRAAAKVRRRLEGWYKRFPLEERTSLAARFRSRNPDSHRSSSFELILHELLIRLGCSVKIHPELRHTSKRPDFGVEADGRKAYVEAKVVNDESKEESAGRRRLAVVYDVLDRLDSPNFFVGVNVFELPKISPDARRIRSFLSEILLSLDPDEVARSYEQDSRSLPRWNAEGVEWAEFFPIPKKATARGEGSQPLGIFMEGGWVKTRWAIKKALKTKAGRYGELDSPYVIALNVLGSDLDEEETLQALFGSTQWNIDTASKSSGVSRARDGFWLGPSGPRNRRVSAVLVFGRLSPWHLAYASARLYHNPWANRPYRSKLTRLPEFCVEHGSARRKRGISLRTVFRIPRRWPEDVRE